MKKFEILTNFDVFLVILFKNMRMDTDSMNLSGFESKSISYFILNYKITVDGQRNLGYNPWHILIHDFFFQKFTNNAQ